MTRWRRPGGRRKSARRANLAAQQAALLDALLAGGSPPPGFDPGRLRAQSTALLAKRRRVISKLRPELEAELGERLPALFEEYGRTHPRRTGTSARGDATAFVEWLQDQGILARPAHWRWHRFLRWLRS